MMKITAVGNLGADAIVRQVNGKAAINFRVGHNRQWVNKATGEVTQEVSWISCTLWREIGKTKISGYLKKGTRVYIEGDLSCKIYTSRTGVAQVDILCRVKELEFMSSPETTIPGDDPEWLHPKDEENG